MAGVRRDPPAQGPLPLIPLLDADSVIAALKLRPHPEGGHYRETFRDEGGHGGRAHSTAILYLLREGEMSHWHRIDAAELWHWYGGDALLLSIHGNGAQQDISLGPDFLGGDVPQGLVPPRAWQSARSLGAWSLAGCTVAPGFDFAQFELAPKGWQPG